MFLAARYLLFLPGFRVENLKDDSKKTPLEHLDCNRPTCVTNFKSNIVLTIQASVSENKLRLSPKGGRDALRRTQKIVDEDKYVVDFDLERFFDMVSHSKLIKILSRGVKYGKV